MTATPMTPEREDEAQMRKPFPSHGDAMTDERLHNRANELLKSKKHSLKVADRFAMTAECQAVIRDMLIEALAIGANDYASPAPTGAGEAEKHAVEKILDMVLNRGATESGTYRERAERIVAALRRAQPPWQIGMSKDWCMAMADLEGDAEIGAGAIDHLLRAQSTGDVEGLSEEERGVVELWRNRINACAEGGGYYLDAATDRNMRALLAIVDRFNSRFTALAWQPIETAPDNEWVLCFSEGWQYPVALMRCLVYDGRADGPALNWQDDTGDSAQNWKPTLWMRWPACGVEWRSVNRRPSTGAGEEKRVTEQGER